MKPKYDYLMDYIPDKDLYKAVMFACKIMRGGTTPELAIRRAAKYYDVDMSDVAHYVGQRGNRIKEERKEEKKTRRRNDT